MKVSKLALYALFICCTALFLGSAIAEEDPETINLDASQVEQIAGATTIEQAAEMVAEDDLVEPSVAASTLFVPLSFANDDAVSSTAISSSSRAGWRYRKICPVTCQPCNTAADCSFGACKSLPYCP